MAAISTEFLQKKSSVLKLQYLSDQMSDINDTLSSMQSLADSGVLSSDEVNSMIADYKSQLQSTINNELSKASDEADMLSSSSESEVNAKLKSVAPVIAGVPVITDPTPIQAAADEATFLGNVVEVSDDLTTILNNLQPLMS